MEINPARIVVNVSFCEIHQWYLRLSVLSKPPPRPGT